MNYLEYFGLQTEPFGNTPATKFFYNSAQHSSVMLRLMHVVEGMRGLALVTGQAGVGKTTMARKLLEQLSPELYESALIVVGYRSEDPAWLLRKLARQLGGEQEPATLEDAFAAVQERLEAAAADGRRTVVLVDEAQMLGGLDVLEQIRGLLNLERDEQKLVTFVLFGSDELETMVAQDAPLDQRVSARVRLERLSKEGTAHYIRHRLRLAGASRELFDAATLEAVYLHTRGTPRLINVLCDNALLEAFLIGREVVDRALVGAVAADLGLAGTRGEAGVSSPLGEETLAAATAAATPEPEESAGEDEVFAAEDLDLAVEPEAESEPEIEAELLAKSELESDVELDIESEVNADSEADSEADSDDLDHLLGELEAAAPEPSPTDSGDGLDELMAELEQDVDAELELLAESEEVDTGETAGFDLTSDVAVDLEDTESSDDDLDALIAEFEATDAAGGYAGAGELELNTPPPAAASAATENEADIDALLADLDAGGDDAHSEEAADDIDALLAQLDTGTDTEKPPTAAPKASAAGGNLGRDDLDDLLSQIDQLEDV